MFRSLLATCKIPASQFFSNFPIFKPKLCISVLFLPSAVTTPLCDCLTSKSAPFFLAPDRFFFAPNRISLDGGARARARRLTILFFFQKFCHFSQFFAIFFQPLLSIFGRFFSTRYIIFPRFFLLPFGASPQNLIYTRPGSAGE